MSTTSRWTHIFGNLILSNECEKKITVDLAPSDRLYPENLVDWIIQTSVNISMHTKSYNHQILEVLKINIVKEHVIYWAKRKSFY